MGLLFNRIKIIGQDIFIKKKNFLFESSSKLEGVLMFNNDKPTLRIFDDGQLIRSFTIDPLASNPYLRQQFLHYSISVQENDAVMIDGIISNQQDSAKNWDDTDYEAIRLQPFFLISSDHLNFNLIGKGLFERGLHYSGIITPSGVRNICICDFCEKNFTLQHCHAGFSEVQYFYSSNSKKTLLVKYGELEGLPAQLQKDINEESLAKLEATISTLYTDAFKYYNSLNCPHCGKPFINFNQNKSMRPNEYYANKFINEEFIYFKKD